MNEQILKAIEIYYEYLMTVEPIKYDVIISNDGTYIEETK